MRSAAVAVLALALGLLGAAPVWGHKEGLTPYRYVVPPAGVSSEGPPESGLSTQTLDRPGFAGTTDNQMQLTLPQGALPPRTGERAVRVTLQQLDPADLPDLPGGLEPEGNAYRVGLVYATSGEALARLARPATLGLSAPAAPTALYELVDETWQSLRYTPPTADEGYTSVVKLIRPGTFLQAHDPATAPPPVAAATPVAAPGTRPPRTPTPHRVSPCWAQRVYCCSDRSSSHWAAGGLAPTRRGARSRDSHGGADLMAQRHSRTLNLSGSTRERPDSGVV